MRCIRLRLTAVQINRHSLRALFSPRRVHLTRHIGDEVSQVPLRQPVVQQWRQQQFLAGCAAAIGSGHAPSTLFLPRWVLPRTLLVSSTASNHSRMARRLDRFSPGGSPPGWVIGLSGRRHPGFVVTSFLSPASTSARNVVRRSRAARLAANNRASSISRVVHRPSIPSPECYSAAASTVPASASRGRFSTGLSASAAAHPAPSSVRRLRFGSRRVR